MVCANGDLRLAGSTTAGQGRVEICINETWGTICDDSWGTPDASVACQALGFSRFGELSTYGHLLKMYEVYFSSNLQELKLYQQLSLDRELDPFSLMMLDVLEMKAASWTALL